MNRYGPFPKVTDKGKIMPDELDLSVPGKLRSGK